MSLAIVDNCIWRAYERGGHTYRTGCIRSHRPFQYGIPRMLTSLETDRPVPAVLRPASETPWSAPAATTAAQLYRPRMTGSAVAARLHGYALSERSAWFATTAAIVIVFYFSLPHVAYIFVSVPGGYHRGMWALAAVAAYLPLHVRHVWFAAHE